MPTEPTIEEAREPFVSGEIETCRRLLEWWTDLAKIGGKHEISAGEIKRAAQFCQFYLEATAKPTMSAGEFAAELVTVCECQCLDWEALANNAPAHEAVLRATRNARLSEWIAMKLTVESLARDHNIEIAEPKK